jgi:hypothetical protein
LHTWFEMQPPGPAQAIDCPGTQAVVVLPSGAVLASGDVLASGAQSHGPYAVPLPVHTWFVEQPPGPTHATDWPGMHAVTAEPESLVASVVEPASPLDSSVAPQPVPRRPALRRKARWPSR